MTIILAIFLFPSYGTTSYAVTTNCVICSMPLIRCDRDHENDRIFFFLLFENSFNDSSPFFLLCFLENRRTNFTPYLLPTFSSTITSYWSFTRIQSIIIHVQVYLINFRARLSRKLSKKMRKFCSTLFSHLPIRSRVVHAFTRYSAVYKFYQYDDDSRVP